MVATKKITIEHTQKDIRESKYISTKIHLNTKTYKKANNTMVIVSPYLSN